MEARAITPLLRLGEEAEVVELAEVLEAAEVSEADTIESHRLPSLNLHISRNPVEYAHLGLGTKRRTKKMNICLVLPPVINMNPPTLGLAPREEDRRTALESDLL